MILRSTCALVAVLIVTVSNVSIAKAQVGIDTNLWEFIDAAQHHQAIVHISSGIGSGTGVIVSVNQNKPVADGFEGYCLTAYHVVSSDNGRHQIKIRYQNGRKAKECRIVAFDEENDIAVVWVWVPEGIQPVEIAPEPMKRGQYLAISGLGGGSPITCCIRHFKAESTFPTSEKTIFANVPLLPGDSGGPGFNKDNQLVGIVSGGWFWVEGEVTDDHGLDIKTTWPARLSNTKPIHDLLTKSVNPPVRSAQR